MKQPRDYKLEIFWSEEDECFIANFPEIQFCSAFGDTREEAAREAQVALELTIEVLNIRESETISEGIEETVNCDKCGARIFEDEGECLHEMLCDDCLRARENPEIYGEDEDGA